MIDIQKMKDEVFLKNPTLYYSAITHLRGKLHMTRVSGSTLWGIGAVKQAKYPTWENGEKNVIEWTMELQEKYVRPTLDKYKMLDMTQGELDEILESRLKQLTQNRNEKPDKRPFRVKVNQLFSSQ